MAGVLTPSLINAVYYSVPSYVVCVFLSNVILEWRWNLIPLLLPFLQDLKDFMRQAGEVTYADAHKYRRNEG